MNRRRFLALAVAAAVKPSLATPALGQPAFVGFDLAKAGSDITGIAYLHCYPAPLLGNFENVRLRPLGCFDNERLSSGFYGASGVYWRTLDYYPAPLLSRKGLL